MSETETFDMVGVEPATDIASASGLPVKFVTDIEWSRDGTHFYPVTRADKMPKLPGGIYRFVAPPMQPWFLDRISDEFEFPFKVYNASEAIINRICKFWLTNGGNLGILMNGLRGAGKTMTAQLIANRLIRQFNIPVLVIRDPIPLQTVFDNVHQDMVIIFDEFEKTHDESRMPGVQQTLLSTIDGMSRSSHNRLIIFTTNITEINENFRDRPSRIHYKFEFNRVADEIIEGLIKDSLPDHLQHFKPDIMQFLNTREICTIDIVKAVISEVRTFEESPLTFEDILNIAKGEPPSYSVYLLDPESGVQLKTITEFFRLPHQYQRQMPLLAGNIKAKEEFVKAGQQITIMSQTWAGSIVIELLEACEEDYCWLAKLRLPRTKTIWDPYSFLNDNCLYLDNRPDDWQTLPGPESVRIDDGAKQELEDRYQQACMKGTVYGTGVPAVFKVQIQPNLDNPIAPVRFVATGKL